MSPTMFLGRIVLPGFGLMLAAILFWQAVWNTSAGGAPETVALGPGREPKGGSDRGIGRAAVRSDPAGPVTITAEGRVAAYPGAQVTVGTEVLGTIVTMPVREKSIVRKGDLLLELRCDHVRAALRKANIALVEAEAGVRSEQERIRRELLLPTFANRASGTRHDMPAALARRDTAKAAVDELEAELAKYRILAPIDGTVVTCMVEVGETVSPAAPLVTIADLGRLRVEAEVDEFDIDRLRLGGEATITAQGSHGRRWRGSVEEIADVISPRRTFPENPGRPSDTRILSVKVAFREATALKLGQRVEVRIAGTDRAH